MDEYREHWLVRKPVVTGRHGMVAAQHWAAARAGARMLEEGGNAVDAAVTAAFSAGVVEPWMSGLGGGGYLLVRPAGETRAWCVDFGMVAPQAVSPDMYPLAEGGVDGDLFGWPQVVGERNVHGPLSVAVPGLPAGLALALERFGTRPLARVLAPAIEQAERGVALDWYATVRIAAAAPLLSRYPQSAALFLPGGFVPAGEWSGALPVLRPSRLAATLRRLAEAGAEDFYRGEIATTLVEDMARAGGVLAKGDLAGYRAQVVEAEACRYRDARVWVAPGLTAGPSLLRALEELSGVDLRGDGAPDAEHYLACARALSTSYRERFATMGDSGAPPDPGCTTHVSVVDRDGTLVSLTQTLLSVFGSKLVLGRSGVLMNNGMMWFDPRIGRPNSIGGGKRPLANMCPVITALGDGRCAALGASGGRRIMPALLQLLSFLVDRGMDLESAAHQGRIDFGGSGETVSVDRALGAGVSARLAAEFDVQSVQHGVYPAFFACPNAVSCDPATGVQEGAAYVWSPTSAVWAAERSGPGPGA